MNIHVTLPRNIYNDNALKRVVRLGIRPKHMNVLDDDVNVKLGSLESFRYTLNYPKCINNLIACDHKRLCIHFVLLKQVYQ